MDIGASCSTLTVCIAPMWVDGTQYARVHKFIFPKLHKTLGRHKNFWRFRGTVLTLCLALSHDSYKRICQLLPRLVAQCGESSGGKEAGLNSCWGFYTLAWVAKQCGWPFWAIAQVCPEYDWYDLYVTAFDVRGRILPTVSIFTIPREMIEMQGFHSSDAM